MKIDKNEYYLYLKKNININLTECQVNMLIDYYENLNTIYKDKKSNEQIKTLLINSYKNFYISKLGKITNLFHSFFTKEFTIELMERIIKENLNDDIIIKYILDEQNKQNIMTKKIFKICDNWTYIIEYMVLLYKKIKIKTKINININNLTDININYMDIGCGSGSKTMKFAKKLNLNLNNVYGADISNWGPYNQKKYNHKFKFVKINDEKIDIEDNSMDFCTCILTLHHVEKMEKFIKDIKRILKPNGILLLIEHNNYDDYDNLTLDILHMLYGYLYDKNNRYLSNPDYAQYHNSVEWNYIMEKNDFNLLESNSLFTELSNDIRYDNVFYSWYQNGIKMV